MITESTESIAIVSVSGGKFHRPANTTFERMDGFKPRLMLCGRTITPLNCFTTKQDADKFTGGRFTKFACVQCEKKGLEQ